MVINKLKKEIKFKKKVNKEQDYVVTSLVKEPSFLKKDISTSREDTDKTLTLLKKKQSLPSVKPILPNMAFQIKENENKTKASPSQLAEWKRNNKISKSLYKSIKKLQLIKYNLKLKTKRLKNKNIPNLSHSLTNAINLIEETIKEIKVGLNKTKKIPVQLDLKLDNKRDNEIRPTDVFETKIYLIKMNIKPESMVNLLKMVFRRKKIVFLIEDNLNYLKETIYRFLDSIFQDSFDSEILLLPKTEYTKFKKHHKGFVVISEKKVLVNDGKENYVKNSKFEKKLIDLFYKNSDPQTGLTVLKKELQEIYELSKEIRKYNEVQNNKISRKKMLRHLEQTFFLKIKKNYFNILLGIVNDYFNKEIKFSEDYIEEKIEKMWR